MDIAPVLAFAFMLVVATGISLPMGRDTAVVRLVVAQAVLAALVTLAYVGLAAYFD